jgi:hypothetical protein
VALKIVRGALTIVNVALTVVRGDH